MKPLIRVSKASGFYLRVMSFLLCVGLFQRSRTILIKVVPCLGLLLLLGGCLKPERRDAALNESIPAEATRVATEKVPSSAPVQIDPLILKARRFAEAPQLVNRVQAGELQPVSQRLPEVPLVIQPWAEIGRYGGTLHRALTGDIVQRPGVSKTLGESLFVYERPRAKSIQPNLAQSYTFSEDTRSITIRLRKGLRWSDGKPFTVDDVLFWYHDMIIDDRAREAPLPPSGWMVDGRPLTMEKVDTFTLRVSSPRPLGRIFQLLCRDDVAYPKHLLSRYHPKYSPDSSYEDFRRRTTPARLYFEPGLPRLSAWVPVEWHHGERLIYQRNPYYWKVDTHGNQLPYADRLVFTVIPDPQVILLKFMNGEVDLFGRYSRISMIPTLRLEEKKGRFDLHVSGPSAGPALYFNWDCSREPLRAAFREKAVRVALSHAVNRDEINQILYHGLLVPTGLTFSPLNPYFSEESSQRYATFNPVLARNLLRDNGYVDSDGDGYRELKDGSRFELTIDVTSSRDGVDVSQLIAEQWREIGVKVHLNIALRDIIWPRRVNGEFDVHYWFLEGPTDPLSRPNDWANMTPTGPFWHRNAFREGPSWLKEATTCMKSALNTYDPDVLRGYMTRMNDLFSENIPIIVVGFVYHTWGSSRRLGNVPHDLSPADEHRGWSRGVFHEQLFIRR